MSKKYTRVRRYFPINSTWKEKIDFINNDRNIKYTIFNCNKWVEDIEDYPNAKLHPCKIMDVSTCGGVSLRGYNTSKCPVFMHEGITYTVAEKICERTGWRPNYNDEKSVVRHLCQENGQCIQKYHLTWGTQSQNIKDAIYSGTFYPSTSKGKPNRKAPNWFVALIKERLFDGSRPKDIIWLYEKYFNYFGIINPYTFISPIKNNRCYKNVNILDYKMNEVNAWLQGETS